MKKIRFLAFAVLLIGAAPLVFAQNLAEAAKKEKERRAAFKNRPVMLITNDALARVSKNPAVSNTTSDAALSGEDYAEPSDRPAAAPDTGAAASGETPQAAVTQSPDRPVRDASAADRGQPSEAGTGLQKAKEYADLLELKLNSLWLQFYSMDDGMPRELLQQEISATFEKYTQAREAENKLRGEAPPAKERRD